MKTTSSEAAFFNLQIVIGLVLCSSALLLALAGLSKPVTGTIATTPHINSHGHFHHYKLIDIGTLGGPHSYFSGDGASVRVLAGRETVAGYGDTTLPDPYPPDCFAVDCHLTHAFRWQNGQKTDLGAIAGMNNSAITEMNAQGNIAGYSENGQIDPLLSFPELEAVFWKDNQIQPLGTLGGNESLALSLNNQNQVTGVATNAVPDDYSMFGWGTQTRAFIWEGDALQDLGTLGGPDAGAGPTFGNVNVFGQILINESGQVAGSSYTNSTPDPILGVPTTDPFLWKKGKGMHDLGTLGGTVGVVNSLNNRGQVVGQSYLEGNLISHAFLWDAAHGMTDLGTLGGTYSTPVWINDAGEIVGQASTENDQFFHATRWQNGKPFDLGTVTGDGCSEAMAVNSEGQIVGVSFACDFSAARAFIWDNGSMADLNQLIQPNSNFHMVFAGNINDQGEIVGAGVPADDPPDTDAYGRLFLLIPCDENHPGIEGCDYSLVDAPVAHNPAGPNRSDEAVTTAANPVLRPSNHAAPRLRFGERGWGLAR